MRHLKYDLEMNVKFEKKNYFGKRQDARAAACSVDVLWEDSKRGNKPHDSYCVAHVALRLPFLEMFIHEEICRRFIISGFEFPNLTFRDLHLLY